MSVIEFQNVSKSYPVYSSPGDRLKELLSLQRLRRHQDFWALRDVSFNIASGETFCVIGENGSGKSTTLQMIAGILRPSSGTVKVAGRVAALLELGSGFNPEFTGRANVYLNAAILGLSSREIDQRFSQIEEFAEIGSFIDQPVKTYSSGMSVRLAFAVAIHVEPEILLVDEALAVGDIYFRQRCLRKVHEMRQQGVTILFVSHAIGDVKAIGDRTLWLESGRVKALGETDKVVAKYLAAMTEKDSSYLETHNAITASDSATRSVVPEVVTTIPNIDHRHGTGAAEIIGIQICDQFGRVLSMLEPLSRIVIRISFKANHYLAHPNVGFVIRNHMGIDFSGTNTLREGHELPAMHPGELATIDFHLDLPELYPAPFSFSPAIANGNLINYQMCDWIDNAITLQMGHGEGQVYGFFHLPCKVEVNARLDRAVTEHSLG